ncbi:MAG: hypothetical protein AAF943_09125 [Pseudomonadota bacterium]
MVKASLNIELGQDADVPGAMARLNAGLEASGDVEKHLVTDERHRGLAETVAVIGAAVLLIDQGTSLLASIKNFVATARMLMVELDKFKTAYLEINGRKVDVMTATDEELEELAQEI